jgi:hypothetical protein
MGELVTGDIQTERTHGPIRYALEIAAVIVSLFISLMLSMCAWRSDGPASLMPSSSSAAKSRRSAAPTSAIGPQRRFAALPQSFRNRR